MTHNLSIGEELLSLGFSRREGHFSNGETANNKLTIDHDSLLKNEDLYRRIVGRMCELAEPYRPAFFIGVPNGATGIARAVAQEYGVHLFNPITPKLKKDPETKTMSYADTLSKHIVRCSGQGALIEDVFRTGFNTRQALTVPYMAAKIAVGICVFDRSVPGNRLELPIDIQSVAQEPISPMLAPDSDLWIFADQNLVSRQV